MKRNWLNVIAIIAVVLSVLVSLPAHRANAANPGDVLIVEVGADPLSPPFTEPAGEYFELFNNSGTTVDLNGWTITDGSAAGTMTVTLPSISLGPGKILVVIGSGLATYACAQTPLNHTPAAWFSTGLGNTSDRLLLRDNLTNLIDAVSYGADVTVLNPAAPDVFNNSGATLQRTVYNTGFVDTDTNADWVASTGAGSPCDVSPTAVTMRDLSASSVPSPAPIAFGVLGLTAAALLLRRRLVRSTPN